MEILGKTFEKPARPEWVGSGKIFKISNPELLKC